MKLILPLILAYLLGSIPSGAWVDKLFSKKDIRQHRSGNTGTTNTLHVLGKTAGVVVLLMDILEDTLTTCLSIASHPSGTNPPRFGVCAIPGHTPPTFAGFRGGKVIATSEGMLLGFNPVFFIYSCIIFIVSPFCTSMVSLSSMISVVLTTLSMIALPYMAPVTLAKPNQLPTIIVFLVSSFIFYRYKDNIKRIRNHIESQIPLGLNSGEKES